MTELKAKRDPFDFPPVTDSITYEGIAYKFRELTVAENDECRDLADIDGKWDGRLMTRLMICKAAVDPEMTLDQLGKIPQRLYAAIVDKVNDLNDPDTLGKDEGKGKPSQPKTSSDTKSPGSSA